jgi:ribosomal protein S18 acetylase RimI-like enzyme
MDGVSFSVRRLNPADAVAYRSVMLHGYQHHGDAFTSQFEEREPLPLDWWKARVAEGDDPDEIVFGAFDAAGKLLGIGGVSFERRPKIAHRSTLFGMCVLPEARGQGVGEAIVLQCIATAKAHQGTEQIDLDVTDTNAVAVRLYERCGFVAYGVKPKAIKLANGRQVDKRLMQLRWA